MPPLLGARPRASTHLTPLLLVECAIIITKGVLGETEQAQAQAEVEVEAGVDATSGADGAPTFEDISTAAFHIREGTVRTRCTHSAALSDRAGCEVWLKHEYEQRTGSFKERGARNALLSLSEDERARGVTCASAGNHALAIAYHAGLLGIRATVVMPTIAPLTKVSRCRALGAEVILHGASIAEAAEYSRENYVNSDAHLTYINGFDDKQIIAGAGTVGLELLEQVGDLDAIVVPAGGGGLIAGILLAVKTLRPDVRVIAVEPSRCASLRAALDAGKPACVEMPGPTLADGLAVPCIGARSFGVIKDRIDETVTVSEQDIAVAVLALVEQERIVQEGAGATGLAAVLAGRIPGLEGKTVAVPLCGSNIDVTVLGRVLDRALAYASRIVRFSCVVSDRPGGIATLTRVVADTGGSIKDIRHEREWLQEDLFAVEISVTCELNGAEHLAELKAALERAIDDGDIGRWGATPLE